MPSAVSSCKTLLLVSCALGALVGAAAAQDAIVLDNVTLEGGAGTGETSGTAPVKGYVAKKTKTGSKSDTPLVEVPQSVSVLGREELDDRGVQKVDEALRYTPGVLSQPYGTDSDTDWIYIRGFEATQTGIFLDNLPLYQYAFGGFIIDPFQLERIEVLRGPASVLYGGSNPGGLVNSVSKRSNGERIRYVETGIDDNPNGYAAFDLGDKITDDGVWSYRLLGKIKGGDTQTNYADNFRGFIAPNVTWSPDATTKLNLYATYQYDDLKHTGGFWPYVGSVVDAPFGKIPRDLFYSDPDVDSFKAKQQTLGWEFEHQLDNGVTLRSNTRFAHVEREEHSPYPFGYTDPTSGAAYLTTPLGADAELTRLNFAHQTEVSTFSTDNQAEFKFDTGAVAHTLLTGIDYKYYHFAQVAGTGFTTPSLSPIDTVYGVDVGEITNIYADETLVMNQLGAYAQDQLKFGDGWIVTLNGRYDEVWIDRQDRTPANADYDGNDGALSGRAGLAYEFANGITPYVSISHSFNPQIGTDSEGKPVDALEGEQYEVGIKYAPTFLDATFTASLFDLTRSNVLQTIQNTNITRAIGEVNSRGVELQANVNIDENWKAIAAFTAYDISIKKDGNPDLIGNRPYVVPEVMASLWLDYTVTTGNLEGLGLGGGIRYLGDSFADNENTLKVPDATVFDAAVRYDRDNWGVSLNVNNVFDKEYVSGCQTAYTCGYGEGRTGLLKAHFSF